MFVRPATLSEALDRLSEGARILAGGTDLLASAAETGLSGDFIDVSRLDELSGVTSTNDEIRFGGAATWSQIARAELPCAFDALKAAAREVGAVQIQNRGTIAGNLCNASPAADGVPPLLMLDAEVELTSLRGRRRLPLQRFIAGPRRTELAADEIVTAIVCPKPPSTMRSTFLKLGARRYLVISIVMVAVGLEIDRDVVRQARVAIGACSPVATRLPPAELTPIGDVRAGADYRSVAALTLTRRAVELCLKSERGGAV